MALQFDRTSKLITVPAPDTVITVQDLVNEIREYECQQANMDLPKILDAVGKASLRSGRQVGITMTLLDDWRIKFEDRVGPDTVMCYVSEGNCVAQNNYSNQPVIYSTYTFVNIEQDTSPALVTASVNRPRAIPGR